MNRLKSFLALVLIITLVFSSFAMPAFAQVSDIAGHWAEKQIKAWMEKGWASGYADGSFRPNNSVTRAEFMTLANRAFGFKETTEINYSDVISTAWYYGEIAKAKAAGYISGYEDGTIRPENPISRQEAAAMLAKILNVGPSASRQALDNFKDKDSIPDWSKGAIAAIVAEGIMSGYPDGTFRPTRNITRAEAIVMLDNAVNTTTVYDKAGTYGPEAGVQTIKGNVTIAASGVILRNVIITGDLLIAEEVGNGDVKLKNVTVNGEVIIKGGGPNSVEFEDCNIPKITVSKEGVRIVASGNTSVQVVTLESGATLVQATVTGTGFAEVTIAEVVPANANIVFSGNFASVTVEANGVNVELTSGTIQQLNVTQAAQGTTITVAQEARVETMTVNAAVKVKGQGTIVEAQVNAANVNFEKEPEKVNKSEAVKEQERQSTGSGSSGGSGGGGGGRDRDDDDQDDSDKGGGSQPGGGEGPGGGEQPGGGDGQPAPRPEPEVYGSMTAYGNGRVEVEGHTYFATFEGETPWYPEDTSKGREAGNRVGVKITIPANYDPANIVEIKIGNQTYNWEDIKDGEDHFQWWPLVTEPGQTFTATIKWNSVSEQTFVIKIDDNATLEPASVAQIGDNKYKTLQAAVDAAGNGDTIKLLGDVSGDGVKVESGKDFTLDLGGHTYTISGQLVGSRGTETNGFQLLKDSNITIKNGKITTTKAKILIQNYSDLTLDGVELIGAEDTLYVLSNNNGKTQLTNGTKITAQGDNVAFDVYYWPQKGYGEVSVEIVDTDVVISGRIEYSHDGSDPAGFAQKAKLIIPAGYQLAAPEGYEWVFNTEGKKELKAATLTKEAKDGLADKVADKVKRLDPNGVINVAFDKENRELYVAVLNEEGTLFDLSGTGLMVALGEIEEIRGYKIGETVRNFYDEEGQRKDKATIKGWLIEDIRTVLSLGNETTLGDLVGNSIVVEVIGLGDGFNYIDKYELIFAERAQVVFYDYIRYNNTLYSVYEFQDKDGQQISLHESTIKGFKLIYPNGNVRELPVREEDNPYLYFNIPTMKEGVYDFIIETQDLRIYGASLEWKAPEEVTVSFQGPETAMAAFTPATADEPAKIDLSKVTRSQLLQKGSEYGIELEIEGVNLRKDHIKFAYAIFENHNISRYEKYNGDFEYQFVTNIWLTGPVTIYYVLNDNSLYMAKIYIVNRFPQLGTQEQATGVDESEASPTIETEDTVIELGLETEHDKDADTATPEDGSGEETLDKVTAEDDIEDAFIEETDEAIEEEWEETPKTSAIVDASIEPAIVEFDKNEIEQADVIIYITWNSASEITAVKKGSKLLASGDDYTVNDRTLIIKKEFLAEQEVGRLVLLIEFDTGEAVTLIIMIKDTTPNQGNP